MRPIDADVLVAKLDDWRGDIEDVDKNDAHDVAYYSAMSRAIRLTEAMPTLDLAPKWISVKDRLPPYIGKKILVVNGHGNIQMLAFWKKVGSNWTWLDCDGHFNHTNDITHWMPLPEPPKEE